MKFLIRFLPGYRLHFAGYDQEGFSPAAGQRGCLSTLLGNPRILIALLMIGAAIFKFYFGTTEYVNDFTGRKQHLAMPTAEQEVRMGLQSAPEMIRQFGGEVADPRALGLLNKVGKRLVTTTKVKDTPYRFQFHLLRDDRTINAFALPGGQICITAALFKLLESEDQLAGVLGHEIGHVVGRHSNQQMATSAAVSGVFQGVGVALSDGHSRSSMQLAQYVGNLVNMKYGREDETEADSLGVKFLFDAGYDPEAMIGVMQILKKASAGHSQPQILSTHPDPGNRIEHIRAEIAKHRAEKQ